ncbi:Spy/CpxP family protein refolding chaperone [Bosea sp. SSUT16]|uniref:Spy/CpxP family protein refolding chaperone n=1 Tax=Bosea spartocytisi TaxID=2773451 RepID=A0A927EF08_9HYPH|nr:Spy/CpxP family protein refolding chaperone [Bosea spartocytisi]MBD3849277.1 Spy/CpxP family protein refolding chaperone [Bosea spartocytisi]MCT4471583.1 Spy/CpxP family protein refolding chaperone [Bosea spartocytisi]
MKPIVLIAASSIAALASTFALAQPQPVPPAGGDQKQQSSETRDQRRDEMRQRRAEQAKARMDQRFAKVREDLKLKPEQVPLFDKVEALIRQRAEQGRERWTAMREERDRLRSADLMERIDARAKRLGERAAASKELADTVRPLWATLSDEQKTVLRRSVRQAMSEGRERFREMREWRGRRDGGDHGPRRWQDNRDRDDGQDDE